MLELKLKRDSINKPCTEIYLKDKTGNIGDITYEKDGNGVMQQITNTTGYGAENETRASLRLLVFAIRKNNTKDVLVLPMAYSTADAATFTLPYEEDAHYVYRMLAVKPFSDAGAYVDGNYAFFAEAGSAPYGGYVARMEAGQWVKKEMDFFMDDTNYMGAQYKAQSEELLAWQSVRDETNISYQINDHLLGIVRYKNIREMHDLRRIIEIQRTCAHSSFCNNYKPEARRIIESLNERIKAFNVAV